MLPEITIVSQFWSINLRRWQIFTLMHDFPTSNVGYPHSIPLNQIPFNYYNGNQSLEFSKFQGLQLYIQSP